MISWEYIIGSILLICSGLMFLYWSKLAAWLEKKWRDKWDR
jgi:hypothetical protein